MIFAANILVLLIALEHYGFMVLEIFLWTKPIGLKTFRLTTEQAETTKVLAMNQGLYNGFLATGLLWAGLSSGTALGLPLKVFFLGCVVIAGIFGGFTVKRSILWVQAAPAALALALLILG